MSDLIDRGQQGFISSNRVWYINKFDLQREFTGEMIAQSHDAEFFGSIMTGSDKMNFFFFGIMHDMLTGFTGDEYIQAFGHSPGYIFLGSAADDAGFGYIIRPVRKNQNRAVDQGFNLDKKDCLWEQLRRYRGCRYSHHAGRQRVAGF